MNKLIITGKLCKDIDLKFSQGTGNATLKNTVATRRKFKDKNSGKYESDFIPVTFFGKSAEFVAEHFTKGQDILIEAHMQSGSYDNKEGQKIYILEAIVDNVEFLGGKPQNQDTQGSNNFGNMNQEEELQEEMQPVDDGGDMPFK